MSSRKLLLLISLLTISACLPAHKLQPLVQPDTNIQALSKDVSVINTPTAGRYVYVAPTIEFGECEIIPEYLDVNQALRNARDGDVIRLLPGVHSQSIVFPQQHAANTQVTITYTPERVCEFAGPHSASTEITCEMPSEDCTETNRSDIRVIGVLITAQDKAMTVDQHTGTLSQHIQLAQNSD
jgi:hypothetical protein